MTSAGVDVLVYAANFYGGTYNYLFSAYDKTIYYMRCSAEIVGLEKMSNIDPLELTLDM